MTRSLLLRGIALGALVLALALGVRALRASRAPAAPSASRGVPAAEGAPGAAAPVAAAEPSLPAPDDPPPLPGTDELDAFPLGSNVDLDAVRAALPDNGYWEASAPTTDERVLREREEAKARWNEAYGKVLSGTGSDEEIRAYFAERQRRSTDAIQFVDYLLEHHGDELALRDEELLHVARRLHLARLQEIPRRLEEAHARKRSQDEARAAWLADEARFRGEEAPTPGTVESAP